MGDACAGLIVMAGAACDINAVVKDI